METSVSLLERLQSRPDEASWERLDQVYRPLIRAWVLRDLTLRQDADDLVQEVMAVLVRELPRFRRQRAGSFRAWLRTVTVHRVLAHRRALSTRTQATGGQVEESVLSQLEDAQSELSRVWDREHDRHVIGQLLQLAEASFHLTTVQAFRRAALDEVPANQVAAELNVSVNAVLLAKSRVLRWLRQEARGLID